MHAQKEDEYADSQSAAQTPEERHSATSD